MKPFDNLGIIHKHATLQIEISSWACWKHCKRISKGDILVNNAGLTKDGFAYAMSEEDWILVLDVNAKGCLILQKGRYTFYDVPAKRKNY